MKSHHANSDSCENIMEEKKKKKHLKRKLNSATSSAVPIGASGIAAMLSFALVGHRLCR